MDFLFFAAFLHGRLHGRLARIPIGPPLQPGRRSAYPQPPAPRARRGGRRASGRSLVLRAVHRLRSPRAPAARAAARNTDAPKRRALRRWTNDSISLASRRRVERRHPSQRRRRALHASRDPRSAQSGSLARRLRIDRSRRIARRADRRTPSETGMGAGGPELLLVRFFAAVRTPRARAAFAGAARSRGVQRRTDGRRRPVPLSLV